MAWPPPLPGRVRWSWLLGTAVRRWRIAPLLRLVEGEIRAGARVASIGSGPGYDLANVARRVPSLSVRWVMLDPQREMLRPTRRAERTAGPTFRPDRIVGDAVDLPLRSSSLDVVLSLGVLCCLSDAAVPAAVEETVRVLRPGGVLLFGVPKWRGADDDERWRRAGLLAVRTLRPGRGLFRKPL